MLIDAYHIPVSVGYTNSILVGLLPIGAIFGCLIYTLVLKYLTRRYPYLIIIDILFILSYA